MAHSLIRLFVEQPLRAGGAIGLSPEQLHYLGNVMRHRAGDELLLFNGEDGEWRGTISEIAKKQAVIEVLQQTRAQTKSPDLTLCFAPVKRAPLDQIAQKATELGVSLLQPVQTARTIVTRVKTERLQANAVEAAEQSERLDVPRVHELMKLDKLLAGWDKGRRLIFCDEAGDDQNARWGGPEGRALPMMEALAPYKDRAMPWAILTGPEGGFTQEERAQLRGLDFVVPVTLGPRILRADTAAFAALALWQAVLGDFNST